MHPVNGTSYATFGEYGSIGRSIQLFQDVRTDGDERAIVHEFGHHAFALGDEYTGPVLRDAVDQGTTFPQWANDDFRLVPLADAQNDPALLDSAYAIMVYGGRAERRIVA
ncbi:MAG: hypothetical protein HOK81_07930, partial [Rhodospirillaceae bacterium]|nr:hypothetical protein [Rhodospirillaceae bacterium]